MLETLFLFFVFFRFLSLDDVSISGLNSGDNTAADDDDQLPLSERAKKLKGKGAEQIETPEDPISLPEK